MNDLSMLASQKFHSMDGTRVFKNEMSKFALQYDVLAYSEMIWVKLNTLEARSSGNKMARQSVPKQGI